MSEEIRKLSLNIVIVDDADFSRKSIAEILGNNGHNIIAEVDSAEAALKSINDSKVDLFIVDVVMPQVSGIELAKVLNDKFPESAIVMMSSLNLEHVIIDSISNGAIDFLRKPFSKDDLIKSVERVAYLKSRQVELDV